MSAPQSYENHSKFVPLYHYVGAPLLLALIVLNFESFRGVRL